MSLSFLALGDSYTIGEGVDQKDRWPVSLAASLTARGIAVLSPRILARTGWTTDELYDAIVAERIPGRFDLVTLLAGVNDQYRGYGVERYRASFDILAHAGLAFAKLPGRVIVLSIPDWGVTPFADNRDRAAIGREIDNFNGVARETASRVGARFVDITPTSRLAATDRTLLAGDGLHPSAAMYDRWVEQVLPVAIEALGAS